MTNKRRILVSTFVYPAPILCWIGAEGLPTGKEGQSAQPILIDYEFIEVDPQRWAQAVLSLKGEDNLLPITLVPIDDIEAGELQADERIKGVADDA